jgi:AMMECR1 domain-containing protein
MGEKSRFDEIKDELDILEISPTIFDQLEKLVSFREKDFN